MLETYLENQYANMFLQKVAKMESISEAKNGIEELTISVPNGPLKVERVLKFAWEKIFEVGQVIERTRDEKLQQEIARYKQEVQALKEEAVRVEEKNI